MKDVLTIKQKQGTIKKEYSKLLEIFLNLKKKTTKHLDDKVNEIG